ncbi:MAG: hypothetical protein ACYC0X_14800 [Pirellulaceae bacterium]
MSGPVVFPRLLIGLIVLICAEVFSGASLGPGLWNPWTLIVTYWLYFAHFFFFTTLAVRTGRTSCGSLYLWGVLFGLYESWITKVIWHGYSGDGKFIMGSIGPYGVSEISMVFFFHPVMAFILPLAVTCLLYPSLRQLFPDLAWLTGTSRSARVAQVYLVLSFVPTMAMNSGGPANFLLNLVALFVLLLALVRLSRGRVAASDARPLVVFGRRGFLGLCLYLVLLYGVTYVYLRPEGLPSVPVQLFTLVFYAVALVGITLHRRQEPVAITVSRVQDRELRLVKNLFALMLIFALVLSAPALRPIVIVPIVVNFIVWTILGALLTWVAFNDGVWERFAPARGLS